MVKMAKKTVNYNDLCGKINKKAKKLDFFQKTLDKRKGLW